MQKVAFYSIKDGLSQCERPSFAIAFVTYCFSINYIRASNPHHSSTTTRLFMSAKPNTSSPTFIR